jgi:hypothetical protein
MMTIQSRQKVLLTGAGFTHNIGTPLADGMWAEIFNQPQVQATPGVRDMLARDFDFEGVYNAILTGNSTDDEKRVITDAVFAAYEKLDGIVIDHYRLNGAYNVYSDAALIKQFGKQRGRAFVFTLNQDLFVERGIFRHGYQRQLIRLGVQEKIGWHDYSSQRGRLEDHDRIRLPSPDEFGSRNDALLPDEGFLYVKLHGSQDWLSYNGERQMVLGRGKEGQIEHEPLLKEYLQVFRDVLAQGDNDLLTVGYSFRDAHINSAILEAIKNHGLKVYVLSPQPVRQFRDSLQKEPPGMDMGYSPIALWRDGLDVLWEALAGYFPYRLTDMLRGAETRDWKTVLEHFFGVTNSN